MNLQEKYIDAVWHTDALQYIRFGSTLL